MKYTLRELAIAIDAELIGNPDYVVAGVASLTKATETDVSFLGTNPYGGKIKAYEVAVEVTSAGCIVASPETKIIEGKQYLLTKQASRAFQTIIEFFIPQIESGFNGVHETAVIHESAKLGSNVQIGPYAVIDQGVVIGDETRIDTGVSIGAKTQIGKNCTLHAKTTVREGCVIGNRVIIQPGAVIGSCGFGYSTDNRGRHQLLKQLGNVVLEDDVEIGANTTIDRARFESTVVKRGTKIDNQVQVAHGVVIGEDTCIAAQSGIAGSSKIGSHCALGGQVGIAGHIEIKDQVMIAARAGVISGLDEPGQYYGEPARPKEEYRRFFMRLLGLEKLYKKQKELEKKIQELTP